jgi:hypothetical protein
MGFEGYDNRLKPALPGTEEKMAKYFHMSAMHTVKIANGDRRLTSTAREDV